MIVDTVKILNSLQFFEFCFCPKENKHREICDFGSGVVWGKIVHFGVVTAQNLKGFFRCDMVILIKTKQNKKNPTKKPATPPHILVKIFVLILCIVTALILLRKLKYLCVFLEEL